MLIRSEVKGRIREDDHGIVAKRFFVEMCG